jgi:hypothetical protein
MILIGENPFRGPLEGVSPENQDFLGPEMATSKARAIWAQKSRDFQFTNVLCQTNSPVILLSFFSLCSYVAIKTAEAFSY